MGLNSVLIYKDGFQSFPEPLYDIFGEKELIEVSQTEMYNMIPNIFSIHPELVIIEKSFERLAKELRKKKIRPFPITYGKASQLGGLLRCSTREDI